MDCVNQPVNHGGFTSMLFSLSDLYHTLLGPWSHGGSSSRVAGHGQHYPINGGLMSDMGQGLSWKGTVPVENCLWKKRENRLILIRLQRTTEDHFFKFIIWKFVQLTSGCIQLCISMVWLYEAIKLKNVLCYAGEQFQKPFRSTSEIWESSTEHNTWWIMAFWWVFCLFEFVLHQDIWNCVGEPMASSEGSY